MLILEHDILTQIWNIKVPNTRKGNFELETKLKIDSAVVDSKDPFPKIFEIIYAPIGKFTCLAIFASCSAPALPASCTRP